MKHFKILFNDSPEGGNGGGGNPDKPEGNQNGDGGSPDGNEGNQTVSKEQFDKLQSNFESLSKDIKTIATERDELKGQIKKADDEKKMKDGKLDELLKAKEDELTAKEKELAENTAYKERWEAHETKRREILKAKLPEPLQKFADKMELDDLEEYVELNAKKDPTDTDGGSPGNENGKLTDAEKADFKELFPHFSGSEKEMAKLYREAKPIKEEKKN